MYNTGTGIAAGAAGLPATGGSPLAAVWIGLAAFALVSAGGALVRVAPSVHRPGAAARRAPTRPRRARGGH